MNLIIGGETTVRDAEEEDIREALTYLTDMTNPFVILEVDDQTYVQASADRQGRFDLEYQAGSTYEHYRCLDDAMNAEQVIDAFCRFLRYEPNWNQPLRWEQTPTGSPPKDAGETNPYASAGGPSSKRGCLGAVLLIVALVVAVAGAAWRSL